jgi:hypothetical protein
MIEEQLTDGPADSLYVYTSNEFEKPSSDYGKEGRNND